MTIAHTIPAVTLATTPAVTPAARKAGTEVRAEMTIAKAPIRAPIRLPVLQDQTAAARVIRPRTPTAMRTAVGGLVALADPEPEPTAAAMLIRL